MFVVVMLCVVFAGLILVAAKLRETREELQKVRSEMRLAMLDFRDQLRETQRDDQSAPASQADAGAEGERLDTAVLFAPLPPVEAGVEQAAVPGDVQDQQVHPLEQEPEEEPAQEAEQAVEQGPVPVPDAGTLEPGDTEALPWQMVVESVDDTASTCDTLEPAPPRVRGLEEALGAKVFVWIGGVALALAGAFLVKYSWENQLLPVSARLVLAAVFGGGMIGAGTWLRGRSERVAAALVGAGVADLYGVTFAASSVYDFLGPVTGFVLLALVTAGAVGLSLRHGRFVALLGLVGGFCTPLLIGDAREASGPLLGYLLVLQIGLVVVTRQRGWIGLSAATLVGSVGWGLVQALTGVDASDRLAAGLLGLGSASVFVLNAAWVQAREQDPTRRRAPITRFGLAVSAVGAAMALLGIVTVRGGYGPQELAMVGLLGAGAIALARLDRRYLPVPWLTLGLSAAMLLASVASASLSMTPAGAVAAVKPGGGFAQVVLAFAVLYAGGGFAACWGQQRALRGSAVSFAWLSGVGGAVMLALGMAFVSALLPRGEVLFGLAAAFYAGMALTRSRHRPHAHAAGPLGLAAWGAVTAAVVCFYGNSVWMGPALAVVGAGAAWSTRWHGLRHHGRWAVAWCAVPLVLMLVLCSSTVWWSLGPSDIKRLGAASDARMAWRFGAYYGIAVAGLVVAVAGLRRRFKHEQLLREVIGVLAISLAVTGGVMVVAGAFYWTTYLFYPAQDVWRVAALIVMLAVVAAAGYAWAGRAGLPFARAVSALPAVAAGLVAVLGLPWAASGLGLPSTTRGVTAGEGLAWLWPSLGVVVAGIWALGWQRRDQREVAITLHTLAWAVMGWGTFAAVRAMFSGAVDPPWMPDAAAMGRVEVAVWTALLGALAPGALALGRVWPTLDPVAALRGGGHVVLGVAAAVGALGLGLVTNPLWALPGIGGAAIFNTGLLAYGVAGLALFTTAIATRRLETRDALLGVTQAAAGVAAGLAVLGVAVLIRHLFHPSDLRLPAAMMVSGETVVASARIGFREYGVYALALLGAGAAATFVGPRSRVWAGPVAAAGVLVAVLGAGGVANPLRLDETVGSLPVLNAVLWVLLGPAVLAGVVAWRIEAVWRPLAGVLAGGAILLVFGGVTLLVRHAFVGADLTLATNDFGAAEWYAYSATWLVLGVALLAAGVCSGRASLRYGSLAVLLLAVCKVFLLDTRHLDGLLRAGSFLGLGLTLMVLGYVYQRFVIAAVTRTAEHASEN